MAEKVEIQLEIESAELDEAMLTEGAEFGERGEVEAQDGLGAPSANLAATVSVIGVITLAWLAKNLVDHWLKDKQRGLMIDLREKPPKLTRLAGAPRGFIVVIDKNGTSKIHHGNYERSEDLMPVLEGALG